jgi:hypothetical protein
VAGPVRTVSQSFAIGSTSVGDYGDAGGLIGAMHAGSVFQTYARGIAKAGSSADSRTTPAARRARLAAVSARESRSAMISGQDPEDERPEQRGTF